MPESFDAMLAELADAAAAATPLPDVARVRRRARDRAVHRRMAASSLALVLLGTCGGTVAVVAGQLNRPTQGTITPGATTDVTSAATPPGGGVAGVAGGASLDASLTGEYEQIAGTWESAAGGEYLVVFPDGGIGVTEKGAWQLCDGQFAAVGSGVFYVDELACGDYGTSGLMLSASQNGVSLLLSVPAAGKSAQQTVAFQRVDAGPAVSTNENVLQGLKGEWTGDDAERRLVVGSGGAVTLVVTDAAGGADAKYTGTVTGLYTNGARVEISCGSAPAANGDECGVIQLERVDATRIYVVGSAGPELFTTLDAGAATGATTAATAGGATG